MKRAIRAFVFLLIVIGLFTEVPKLFHSLGLDKYVNDLMQVDILLKIWILVLPCIVYLYVFKNDIDIKECLKLNKLTIKQVVLLILIGFLLQPLAMFISSVTSLFFSNEAAKYMSNLNETPFWMMVLGMAILPAVMEELLMRGIVLYEYRDLGMRIAIVMNGVLFGILHRNFSQFFYAFALGSIFAYIIYKTNSIYSTMIIHFIINGTQVTLQRVLVKLTDTTIVTTDNISLLTKISSVGITLIFLIISIPFMITAIKKLTV